MPNPFLDRIRADELTLMLGIRFGRSTDIIRIAKATGHHAVMIDLEHSTMDLDTVASLSTTAHDLGLWPLVRVREREYAAIGPILDGGALGIVAPRVETAEQAATVVAAAKFPPQGQRSQIASLPYFSMRPVPATTSNPAVNEATIVQVLIETPLGVANANAIASLDGVDILAMGLNDLTAELGIPGAIGDPQVLEAVSVVAAACRAHGKPLMVGGTSDLSLLDRFRKMGASSLLLTGTDGDLLFAGAQSRAGDFTAWDSARQHGSR